MGKLFTPNSTDLLNMIGAAEAKFAGDREQTQLQEQAQAYKRAERASAAACRAQQWKRSQEFWGLA